MELAGGDHLKGGVTLEFVDQLRNGMSPWLMNHGDPGAGLVLLPTVPQPFLDKSSSVPPPPPSDCA